MKCKLVTMHNDNTVLYGIKFSCPGCGLMRDRGVGSSVVLPVDWCPPGMTQYDEHPRPRWGFNGDLAKPTFTPSILSRWDEWQGANVAPKQNVCHSFVNNGMIQLLSDCTHALAGQTVELPELEYDC